MLKQKKRKPLTQVTGTYSDLTQDLLWTAKPFQLDSKAPTMDYEDFIMGEVRYNSLARSNPERAKELFAKAKKNAEEKYAHLVKLAQGE